MSYQNPAMDKLIDAARFESDPQKYKEEVDGFINIAFTEVPRIPLFQPYLVVAMQKNIAGYRLLVHPSSITASEQDVTKPEAFGWPCISDMRSYGRPRGAACSVPPRPWLGSGTPRPHCGGVSRAASSRGVCGAAAQPAIRKRGPRRTAKDRLAMTSGRSRPSICC